MQYHNLTEPLPVSDENECICRFDCTQVCVYAENEYTHCSTVCDKDVCVAPCDGVFSPVHWDCNCVEECGEQLACFAEGDPDGSKPRRGSSARSLGGLGSSHNCVSTGYNCPQAPQCTEACHAEFTMNGTYVIEDSDYYY
jgi:hypothetical protein